MFSYEYIHTTHIKNWMDAYFQVILGHLDNLAFYFSYNNVCRDLKEMLIA